MIPKKACERKGKPSLFPMAVVFSLCRGNLSKNFNILLISKFPGKVYNIPNPNHKRGAFP